MLKLPKPHRGDTRRERLTRFTFGLGVTAALLIPSVAQAYAATASTAEHARLATAVANAIRDNGPGIFRTRDVDLGPAAIELPWAIADWRSVEGNSKGQVIFRYFCDSWNVAGIAPGTFNAQELAARGVPPDKATRLLADLSRSAHDVAYTKIGQPGLGC